MYSRAECGLITAKRWFDQNRLTVNFSKTKHMAISLRADLDPLHLDLRFHTCGAEDGCVSCECIERVNEYKYLGVVFDNRLKWSGHVNHVRAKLRKFVFIFSNLSNFLSVKLLKIIFFAYIQSTMQYGIIAWGGGYRTILAPLETIQKKIIKIILHKPLRYPTELLFDDFKVFNMSQLYIRTILLYIYKNKQSMFSQTNHNYSTRSATNTGIQFPKICKSINKTSSDYIATIIFSKLPDFLKRPKPCTINTYKRLVNKWLVEIGRDQIYNYLTMYS